ncbi:type II toxin-antitoxin system RelE/ParE family toxin [Archangium minus]|uniref:Type II toxin-antitoxin system RelE/ParE family toxin n=1 Tax=Archangium minus TaxID=83450 RepID=A0ABY9WGY6_9BACT|nr:type II toxin-antitoxin system RelE/ParE family toxin [Archangium violaceum]WNG42888.1 type II toxin-antitoxin system RelE/ParE family toxin [Archangium minus]
MSRRARVRWTHRAVEDLRAIGRYIAEDDPRAARQWIERLRQRAHEAASTPKAGRRVPEVDREDIREVLLRSYRIVYRVARDGIEVLTVFEGHRLLPGGAVPEEDKG